MLDLAQAVGDVFVGLMYTLLLFYYGTGAAIIMLVGCLAYRRLRSRSERVS